MALDAHLTLAEDTDFDPAWDLWRATSENLEARAVDLVVTVGLSTDPWPMVQAYIQRHEIAFTHRLSVVPTTGTGASSVRSGRHAVALADDLANRVSLLRASGTFTRRVHLFMAVPNGFSFFLDQRIRRLGELTLYEYDFEGTRGSSYDPSLSLPVPPAPFPEVR